MRVRGFHAYPLPQLNHKPWRLARIPREKFRGAIRGAAARERLLYPSPAKAMQRKIRRRLVAAYVRRFGSDEFAAQFREAKMPAQPRSNWLPSGYAWWRDRIRSSPHRARWNGEALKETMRQARAADAAAMHRVRMSVLENRLTSVVLTEHDYVAALDDGGRGWVIEEEATIVGFAVGNAKTGNIWALFVEPGHEGKGYGRQLHDAMVTWLWAQGLPRLWLTTERDTRAERFYRKAGWSCIGTVKGGELRFELQRPESRC